jgi:hypothetical protein
MHSDHRVTNAEDAAFDTTMKVAGAFLVLVVIAVAVMWYIS